MATCQPVNVKKTDAANTAAKDGWQNEIKHTHTYVYTYI